MYCDAYFWCQLENICDQQKPRLLALPVWDFLNVTVWNEKTGCKAGENILVAATMKIAGTKKTIHIDILCLGSLIIKKNSRID